MKKKTILLLSIVFAITSCSLLNFFIFNKKPYSYAPIKFLGANKSPYFDIQIEGNTFKVLIDLGSNSPFELTKDCLDTISTIPLNQTKWLDIKGNTYSVMNYLIPEIKLDNITFNDIRVRELPLEFLLSGSSINDEDGSLGKENLSVQQGTIGLNSLKLTNALFDFKSGKYFAVRDFKALKKEGYDLSKMTEIPFKLLDDGILVSVQMDQKQKNFIIDTGCSHTLIKEESLKDLTQTNRSGDHIIASQFDIGSFKTGKKELLVYSPANLFFDGLIGMDILRNCILAIDFKNEKLYLTK